MNKKLIIVLTIIGVIGVITLIIFLVAEKSEAPNKSQQSNGEITNQITNPTERLNSSESQDQKQPVGSGQGKSVYTEYSPQKVAADSNTKILFFHAPWCPQCRQLDADITNNISTDNGVTIYKVDYDTNQELRKKYGVTIQTTLVRIDNNGNLVKKYVAYQEPTYANVKSNLY